MFNIKIFNRALDMCFNKYTQVDLARFSVLFAVIISVLLVVIKVIAWIATKSISMQASVNDSCLDVLASFIAYHALKFSSVKFDVGHNFGHEKVEGIVAIFQCLVVMYSGFMIFHEAYEVFVNPRPIANTSIGVIVMIISCIALYKLLYFQKYVAIRTESIIVKGDSLHYLSDFFMNICVIISLILSERFVYVDVVCGLTVGCYVFYSAFLIMKNAINDLMDKALPQKTQSEIIKAIESVDGVKKIKILRTRFAGMKKYVEARVAIEADISFLEANKIAENSENEVKKLFEKVDVIIKTETA